MALFEVLGTVAPRADDRFEFRLGAEHHVMHKPGDQDLSAAEVVALRHLVERASLAPELPAIHASPGPRDLLAVPGLLVAMDHHGAKVFQIDATATDPAYYERISQIILAGTAEGDTHVVFGDGHGHSNAAHHLVEYLRAHHNETYGRTVTELVADLSSLTKSPASRPWSAHPQLAGA